jgi:AbrB family looped-hinge helix DNA binding protein
MNSQIRTKLSDGGRVIIPLELRQAFRLKPGDELIFSHDEAGIHILTLDLAVERARLAVCRLTPPGRRGSEELKHMRQADARREADGL